MSINHRFALVIARDEPMGQYGTYHEEWLPSEQMVRRRARLWKRDFPGCTTTIEDIVMSREEVI